MDHAVMWCLECAFYPAMAGEVFCARCDARYHDRWAPRVGVDDNHLAIGERRVEVVAWL